MAKNIGQQSLMLGSPIIRQWPRAIRLTYSMVHRKFVSTNIAVMINSEHHAWEVSEGRHKWHPWYQRTKQARER